MQCSQCNSRPDAGYTRRELPRIWRLHDGSESRRSVAARHVRESSLVHRVLPRWTNACSDVRLRETRRSPRRRALSAPEGFVNRHPIIAAILSTSLAFQLMLAGVGPACAMPGGDSDGTASRMVMTGMQMDAARPGAVDQPHDTNSSHPGSKAPPCDQPPLGAACQLMGPCTGSFVTSGSIDALEATATPGGIARFVASSPPSRSTAPELPPPRA